MEKIKLFFYKLLDLLMLGRGMKIQVNDFVLRFPTRYFRWFPADYEKKNFQFLRENCKPGDTVLDIGAHIGLFSVCALQCTALKGKVYAFEPTPSTFSLLKKTVEINDAIGKIIPVQAAVADKKGKTTFYLSENKGNVSNSLVNHEERNRQGYEVDLISLDEFVQENNLKINFIKIDAEGAELSVLKGACKLLEGQRPVCILAMHPRSIIKFGDTSKAIWDFIGKLKYTIIYEGSIISEKEFCEKVRLFDVCLIPA